MISILSNAIHCFLIIYFIYGASAFASLEYRSDGLVHFTYQKKGHLKHAPVHLFGFSSQNCGFGILSKWSPNVHGGDCPDLIGILSHLHYLVKHPAGVACNTSFVRSIAIQSIRRLIFPFHFFF